MVWVIGEYAERIDNADELLEQFLDNFPEETTVVRPVDAVCSWHQDPTMPVSVKLRACASRTELSAGKP